MRARSMKLPASSLALTLCLAACASSSTTSSGANTTPTEAPPPAMTDADAGAMTAPTAEVDAGAMTETPAAEADAGAAMTETPDAAAPTATQSATPPTSAPSRPTTATPDAAMIARGRAAHQRVCARCHEDGDSDGPHRNGNWAEARMRTQIRQGNSQMRPIPVSRLSDADLDALIAYYRSIRAVR